MAALRRDSLASLDTGLGGRGAPTSARLEDAVDPELQMEEGTGIGVVVLATEVEMEEVVRCKAEDKAAEREATEPITDEREVVGGAEEYPGRLYRWG